MHKSRVVIEFTALVLILALLIPLVSCGGGGTGTTATPTATPTATTTTPTPTPTPTPIPGPSISSVTPSKGLQGYTMNVTIIGTYFTGTTTVSFGSGITVNNFTVYRSYTRIRANITIAALADTGARDVKVTTPGGTATLTGGFTVVAPPSITSVSPNKGAQGQTVSVTIRGTYFTGATAVSFGSGITVNSFTVNSSNQITGNITLGASAALGPRNVKVTTSGGTATLTNGFTIK